MSATGNRREFLAATAATVCSASAVRGGEGRRQVREGTAGASITLAGPGYSLSIHDNRPSGDPPAGKGQNGIRAWRLDAAPDLRLVAHSWLNLEHVITADRRFSGNREDPGFFEPRQSPVALQRTDRGIRLRHGPLPRTGCACWVEYIPADRPGTLDFRLGLTPTRRVGAGEVIGLFLPCYIFQPDSKSIHFIGRTTPQSPRRWVEYCSSCHHADVNFASEGTRHRPAYEATPFGKWQTTASYSYPFFWGGVKGYTFVLMLDGGEEMDLRFWMSPEGGGMHPETRQTNPAWDFAALRFDYELHREYTARGRLMVRPTMSRPEIVAEYEAWSGVTCTWE